MCGVTFVWTPELKYFSNTEHEPVIYSVIMSHESTDKVNPDSSCFLQWKSCEIQQDNGVDIQHFRDSIQIFVFYKYSTLRHTATQN